jgi:hypothetical protein
MLARFTGGISPVALSLAWLDWSSHLAAAPQRQMEISRNVLRDTAGVVAAPHEPWHNYQVMTKAADAPYVGPDEWLKLAPHVEGSWWPEWAAWLAVRSGVPCDPPPIGVGSVDSLPEAPGDYVHT